MINLGDAEFAMKVLKPMGCTVKQTSTTTTVTGPKQLLPLSEINMESMTDAFMTALVLAVVARNPDNSDNNTTRITGIANQRVKECDRIGAMVEQLSLLGVEASELPDGIKIHGIEKSKLKLNAAGVKCYDDHRIAMSFSILACGFPQSNSGLIVLEKKCVEKTWPTWWDTLQTILNVETKGRDLHPPIENENNIVNDFASIILIGMRGVGKSSMGKVAAEYLNYSFIDMDSYFESKAGCTIPEYIENNDWISFRLLEAKCLEEVLNNAPFKSIISCGGGVVETESCRNLLKDWNGLVIHLKRDLNSVKAFLATDTTRPSYKQDFFEVWKHREPLYQESANSDFIILSPSNPEQHKIHYHNVNEDFARYLDFKTGRVKFEFPTSPLSFFISLTCTHVNSVLPILDIITVGADAVELRVDLLLSTDIDFVEDQISLLRYNTRLPIVYTVRTKSQGGRFPDDNPMFLLKLLKHGIRTGCEYIDIEFNEPYDRFTELLKSKGNSKIIASFHDIEGTATWEKNGSMAAKYLEFYPYADVIKLIGRAYSFKDNFSLYRFVNEVVPSFDLPSKPLIALMMGSEGQLSRHLNTFLTPVTHPALPVSAAPGQVSIRNIHQTRANLGLIPPKKYCLFGSPISHSMSPTIHNTGFDILGLPHKYILNETSSWKDVREQMNEYAGASVTIPLKVDVMKNGICDHVEESAQYIGAVNTLYKNAKNEIIGTNTDWIGIKRCIENQIHFEELPFVAIVLGAGGTSRAAIYALTKIRNVAKIRLWNRTSSKGMELAKEFNIEFEPDLTKLMQEKHDCNYIIVGSVPAEAQISLPISEMFAAASVYHKGILVDMPYKPRETKLLKIASLQDKPWSLIEGIQVLIEQGFEQFKIWTGRTPPIEEIEQKVVSTCFA
jgi:pentafunctional AROM polypeptide